MRGWAGEDEGKEREREGPLVTVEPGPLQSLVTPLLFPKRKVRFARAEQHRCKKRSRKK